MSAPGFFRFLFAATTLCGILVHPASAQQPALAPPVKVSHNTANNGDLDIFNREAGPIDVPAILVVHMVPTS